MISSVPCYEMTLLFCLSLRAEHIDPLMVWSHSLSDCILNAVHPDSPQCFMASCAAPLQEDLSAQCFAAQKQLLELELGYLAVFEGCTIMK